MRNTFISNLVEDAPQNDNIILMVGDLGSRAVEPFQESFLRLQKNVNLINQLNCTLFFKTRIYLKKFKIFLKIFQKTKK